VSFMVATYNILADAYVRRDWYPNTSDAVLEPASRRRALLAHLVELNADVLCLQEVESGAFAEIADRLAPLGYAGLYSQKSGGKPDGCATFYRSALLTLAVNVRHVYADASKQREASGHVAQLVSLEQGAKRLGVANTHLPWDPPGTPRAAQIGYQQADQLLEVLERQLPGCAAWIICGDLNATPESELVQLILRSGFASSHAGHPHPCTFNAKGFARTIDYIFYSDALCAEPLPLPSVDAHTVLPGPEQPSDHLAVAARFSWDGSPD
jgi:mRNA deadenylase 3'-5' endonuclease subunit Ccr4